MVAATLQDILRRFVELLMLTGIKSQPERQPERNQSATNTIKRSNLQLIAINRSQNVAQNIRNLQQIFVRKLI